jgi:hypothetical protein
MDIITNYKTLELPEEKLEGMQEDFNKWINNNSYLGDYNHLTILRPDQVLVRLYRFEAPLTTLLVGEDGENSIMGLKILPYVKVIKAPEGSHLNARDVLCTSETITHFKTNPAWTEWKILQTTEEGTEIPEPPKIMGLLTAWRDSMVRKDPFEFCADDEYTFLLSDREFKIAYKKV